MGKHIYNRYEAQEYHRKELKRRHTPYRYANYESYVDQRENEARGWESYHPGKHYFSPKFKPWYQCYWFAYTGYVNPRWKKNLKYDASRIRRKKYRRELQKYLSAIDFDDCEGDFSPQDRGNKAFGDPWNWD